MLMSTGCLAPLAPMVIPGSQYPNFNFNIVLYYIKGVGRAGGGSWGARNPLCKPFLSKQPTIFRGENAMTILFDTV